VASLYETLSNAHDGEATTDHLASLPLFRPTQADNQVPAGIYSDLFCENWKEEFVRGASSGHHLRGACIDPHTGPQTNRPALYCRVARLRAHWVDPAGAIFAVRGTSISSPQAAPFRRLLHSL
jgi:hypothetical protein